MATVRINISGTFTNCKLNVTNGQNVTLPFTVKLTANDGYSFDSTYYFGINTDLSNNPMTVKSDTLQEFAMYAFDTTTKRLYFSQNMTAKRIAPESVSPFVTIYNPDNEIMKQLSKTIFLNATDSPLPISDYIISLYILPFDITEMLSTDTRNIILGNNNSNIQCRYLTNWVLNIDGGTTDLIAYRNNASDFNTDYVDFYIPFYGIRNLGNYNVINRYVKLEITVNLYTRYTTYTLLTSENNTDFIIFDSFSNYIGYEIPLLQRGNVSNVDLNITRTETSFNPYIFVSYKNIHTVPTVTGQADNRTVKLSQCVSGYYQIDYINFSKTGIPQELQDEIFSILSGGFFL